MASRFASVSEEEVISMKEVAVPKNTKIAKKFGVRVFNGKLFHLSNLLFYGEKSKYDALFTKTVVHYNYSVNN